MDEIIKKAIQNELIRKPSVEFSDNVMNRIFEIEKKKIEQPLISTRIWIAGIISITVLSVFAFFQPSQAGIFNFDSITTIVTHFKSIKLPQLEVLSNVNLLIITGICLAVFLLFFIDFLLSGKKKESK